MRTLIRWPTLVLLVALAVPATAQQRPLLTEDPRIIPEGELRLESGVGYFNGAHFPVSGLSGNLVSVVGGIHVGMGRAEFQTWGPLHHFLWIDGGGRTSDWGDGVIGGKFSIATESGRRPDVSFQVATVLPNTSNESGLGKDGTDVYMNLLFGKSVGAAYLYGKAGLGILDDAERLQSQQDVLAWGIAGLWPLGGGVTLAAEVAGLYNAVASPTAGGEDRAETRVGARWTLWGMDWDAAATAGLTDVDHDFGFVAGTTARFRLW